MEALYGFPAVSGDGALGVRASARAKRKDLDEVYDEFSEFSPFSPARKARRLDAELPPILEGEEDFAAPNFFNHPEEMDVGPSNEERAIVLYKPVQSRLADFPSSSDVLFTVDPDVMSGFKNREFWSPRSSKVEIKEIDEEASEADGQPASGSCLAVVPWVPSQSPVAAASPTRVAGWVNESGEGDMGAAPMDVEEEVGRPTAEAADPGDGMVMTQGFQRWQQHCMLPHISPSNSTPVTWSWR